MQTSKRGATPKSKCIDDMVLLKAEKTNKLSTNFNPDPFKVVHTTGLEAQGPEEMCLSLEHQNPLKTSEIMGYFDCVTVSLLRRCAVRQ